MSGTHPQTGFIDSAHDATVDAKLPWAGVRLASWKTVNEIVVVGSAPSRGIDTCQTNPCRWNRTEMKNHETLDGLDGRVSHGTCVPEVEPRSLKGMMRETS